MIIMDTQTARHIQDLVAEGDTEKAIDTLNAWVGANSQTDWIRHCILLKARWEKLQRDHAAGMIGNEEMRAETNQVNAAVLDLLSWRPSDQQASNAAQNKRTWLVWLPVAGLMVLAVAYYFTGIPGAPSAARQTAPPSSEPQTAVSSGGLRWTKGKKAALAYGSGATLTYEILDGKLEDFNPESNRLQLQIRYSSTSAYATNFWDGSFRFIADDQTSFAPGSGLNEVVEGGSFKNGNIYFILPKAVKGGALQIKASDQTTSLPVMF